MQSTFTLGQEIMQSFVLPDHTAAPAMREGGNELSAKGVNHYGARREMKLSRSFCT